MSLETNSVFLDREMLPQVEASLSLGRIIAEHKSQYIVACEEGEFSAQLTGRFRYTAEEENGFPSVGDYVGVVRADEHLVLIQQLIPRKTMFYKKDSYHNAIQVLAANFDYLFICMSLNQDYNLGRLQRYLIMAGESGAQPVVILTKADLCGETEEKAEACRELAGDIPVHTVSIVTMEGLEGLRGFFAPGKTVAAVGSSGAGKSSLVNALAGETLMKTGGIREDDGRGHHTTVHRQMFVLPGGGIYLDMPGIREIGLAEAETSVRDFFAEIEELQESCRFSDCTHGNEPGCAIRAALEDGSLTETDYKQYQKLKKEAKFSENRAEYMRDRSRRFIEINKNMRAFAKQNRKNGRR